MLRFQPPHALLELNGKRVFLDAPGETSFVSHAHSDHSSFLKKSKGVIATSATLDLLDAHALKTESSEITLLNSGHVLGGAQLHVEQDGFSFTYSSDFKLEDSLTLKGAETRESDVLLMEATYGLPQYSFPKREDAYSEIASWVKREHDAGKIVLLGGYALGKAQELIKCLNEYAGITPLVSEEIGRVNAIYAKHGISLSALKISSDEGQGELKTNFVAVLPMHSVKQELASALSHAYKKSVSTAIATGWASYRPGSRVFCLSDHADFNDLVEYAERSRAKKIFTTHGFAEEFARDLRKRGLNAQPLENIAKTTITQWQE